MVDEWPFIYAKKLEVVGVIPAYTERFRRWKK
jgi:hypothetical protein